MAFCLDFIKCMDWVAKQIADVADANNQYFVWKMEQERGRSEVGSLHTPVEYSEHDELPLWQEFQEWRRTVAAKCKVARIPERVEERKIVGEMGEDDEDDKIGRAHV